MKRLIETEETYYVTGAVTTTPIDMCRDADGNAIYGENIGLTLGATVETPTAGVVSSIDLVTNIITLTAPHTYETGLAVQMAVVAHSPSTVASVDATANTITVTGAHNMVTGEIFRIASSVTLPTPLAAATDYYAIVSSPTVFKAATTYANAIAGTAIDLSDAGVGTITVTPQAAFPAPLLTSTNYYVIGLGGSTIALATSYANAVAGTKIDLTTVGSGTMTLTYVAIAGGTYKVQWANTDAGPWVDEAAATNITTTANFGFRRANVENRFFRLVFTLTTGQVAIQQNTLVRGRY